MYRVTKRDGSITEFHIAKIGNAITRAFEAVGRLFFLFISTLYLKLGNKRKMIAVSTQISGTEIGAERFLSAIFLIIF